jgi:hypothetical protein
MSRPRDTPKGDDTGDGGLTTPPSFGNLDDVNASPFAHAILKLQQDREEAVKRLEEIDRALAALSPVHQAYLQQHGRQANVDVKKGEFRDTVPGKAAETLLQRANRELSAAELRTLMELGGKSIGYRHLYNTLVKKSKVFYRQSGKWGLTAWPSWKNRASF